MSPVAGWRRVLFRAPIPLYRWGFGGLVPKRCLLLEHTGRRSGELRRTVLEVVDHDPATGSYHVAAGFGSDSQWYRNLEHDPAVRVQVGRRRFAARASLLDPAESGAAMADYARRYPRAARSIMRMVGIESDGSQASYREIGRSRIPFVRLDPVGTDAPRSAA